MPQNGPLSGAMQQNANALQNSVFNSAHGSTMMDQNIIQNLTLQ